MGKIENMKDKAVGKMTEAAGQITNDQELEFVGKFKTMTSEVKDRMYDVKEDMFQEANELMDKANAKLKKNNK